MSLFTKLARNSLWLLIARIGTQISLVIVTYLLARRLGVAGFGEYSFIAAALVIGNTLTTFGSDMALIREIAAQSKSTRLSSALILQLVLSGLCIIFVFRFAPYLPNQTYASLTALRVYSFALIPLAFFTVFTSALRGWQKMGSYAWLNLIVSALQVIAITLFIPRGASVLTLACLLVTIQLIGATLAGLFCFHYIPDFWNGLHFSFRATWEFFIDCLPIAVIAILGILYQRMSLGFLSVLGNASMVGSFSAAARVVEAARIGHIAVFTALYPAMANANSNKDAHRAFNLSLLLLLIIASGWMIILFLLAKPIVNVFFGAEYQQSISVLTILSLSLIPYTINSFLSLKFLAERNEKVVVYVLLVSLIMLGSTNLWLIPQMREAGAGWAILIAETVQACAFLFVWKTNRTQTIQTFRPSQGVTHELSDLSR